MTYIFCAFEAEARALIDSYKLVKQGSQLYPLFSNKEIKLIITGMGQDKAKEAGQAFLSQASIHKDDVLINIGVCAAKEEYKVGELLEIKSIHSEDVSYELQPQSLNIRDVSCFSAKEAQDKTSTTDIAEMEALSLYEVLKDSYLPEKMSFLKIVSDNFQPFVPKKKFIIELIQSNIKEIKAHINKLQGENNVR